MIEDDVMEETGYGISTKVGDGEDRLLFDCVENKVRARSSLEGTPEQEWTFEEFIKQHFEEEEEVEE